ncbi:unnamed protein product [Rhizoctonia solani]|uniref:Uncharacterized protein n=1 Tax=Rhizoctonia solani TaxID=456999 RepID=A0A8H2X7Q5_9AGAM|nr:unnamed protein product [Rhizoctonia solani]
MVELLHKSLLGMSQILLSGGDDEESLEYEDSMHPEGLLDTQSSRVQSGVPLPSLPISNHSLSTLEHDVNLSPADGVHASALVATTTQVVLPSTENRYSQHLSDPGNTVTPHQLQPNSGTQSILWNDLIAFQDTNSVTSQDDAENALQHHPKSSAQEPGNTAGDSAH